MFLFIKIYGVVLAVMSLVTFVLYGLDKRRARRDTFRIPEARLHWFALLGGWPGAIAGQRYFRHKTQKTRFRLVFWGCVFLHTVVVVLLCYLLWR